MKSEENCAVCKLTPDWSFFSRQPAVCTRELCVFSFYTLGVMSGAAEEVATGAEVCTHTHTRTGFYCYTSGDIT